MQDECQWATAAKRVPHVRQGEHPRDPRIPFADDPTKDLTQAPNMPGSSTDKEATMRPQNSPPATSFAAWKPATDLDTVTALESLRPWNGWTQFDTKPALVQLDARMLRTCEPRFAIAKFPFRTTYGQFVEFQHGHGIWWSLQIHADARKAEFLHQDIGYSCEMVVQVFQADGPSPQNSFTPKDAAAPKQAPSKASSARGDVPLVDQEHGEEPELPPIRAREAAAPGDEAEAPPGIENPDWSNYDLGRALRNLFEVTMRLCTGKLSRSFTYVGTTVLARECITYCALQDCRRKR